MLLTSKYNARSGAKFFNASSFITVVMNVWIAIWLYIIIILISLSGEVQLNPGPKEKSSSAFLICHWNLKSYAKVLLLEAYIVAQKFYRVQFNTI